MKYKRILYLLEDPQSTFGIWQNKYLNNKSLFLLFFYLVFLLIGLCYIRFSTNKVNNMCWHYNDLLALLKYGKININIEINWQDRLCLICT